MTTLRRALLAATVFVAVAGPASAQIPVTDVGANTGIFANLAQMILSVLNQGRQLANDAVQLANEEIMKANQVTQIFHAYNTLRAVTGGNIYAIRALLPELAEAGMIDPLDADWLSLQELLVSGSLAVSDVSNLAARVRSVVGGWSVWTPRGNAFVPAMTRQSAAVWSGHHVAARTLSEAAGKRSKHVAGVMQAGAATASVKQAMDLNARLTGENVIATQQATQAMALVAQGQARREMQDAQVRQAHQASAQNLAARAKDAYEVAAAGKVQLVHGPVFQTVALAADTSAFDTSAVAEAEAPATGAVPGVSVVTRGERLDGVTYGANTSALDTMTRNLGAGAVESASAQGVNPNATAAVCMAESGCRNLGAHSSDPRQTASGAFGYTTPTFNATAAAAGLDTSAGRNDGAVQAALASYDLARTTRTLQGAGIATPTALDAYGAHMFGAGNAVSIATASDDSQLSSVLRGISPATLAGNRLTGMTVGQWRQSVERRMGDAANAPVLL